MNEKDKIEVARNILNNAASLNVSKEVLLRISQIVDKYVVEYYRKNGEKKEIGKRSNGVSTETIKLRNRHANPSRW